jgi:hypothetical protein
MTQERRRYSGDRSAVEMDRRMTTLEQQVISISNTLQRTNDLIDKLDHRQDRTDILQARMIGGLIVAQFLAILFAPAIRAAFGLAPQ